MSVTTEGSAASTAETAIDPTLPICDPHHHLWVHRGRYLAGDFLADCATGHNIVSTVFVACEAMYRESGPAELRPVGETEFVVGEATSAAAAHSKTALAAGIVGFADLGLGARVAEVLDAHLAASPDRFRGIRFPLAWDPSPEVRGHHSREGWTKDANFRAAYAALGARNLSFDAWVFHPQLPELAELADSFPNVTMILNHAGGPLGHGPYQGKSDEVFAVWSAGMRMLAERPNVYVKLGGFGMPRIGFPWSKQAVKPTSLEIAEGIRRTVNFCIEQFGPQRCMFESNFPSDKTSFSYVNIWNAFKRLTASHTQSERATLFHDTAAKAYQLG